MKNTFVSLLFFLLRKQCTALHATNNNDLYLQSLNIGYSPSPMCTAGQNDGFEILLAIHIVKK